MEPKRLKSSAEAWARVIIVNHNSGPLLQACINASGSSDDSPVRRGQYSTTPQAMARQRPCASPTAGFGCIAPAPISALPPPTISARRTAARTGSSRSIPTPCRATTWLEELRNATLRHPGAKMFGSTQIDARKPGLVDGFGDVYSVFGTAWRGASGWRCSRAPAGRSRGVCALRRRRALCA